LTGVWGEIPINAYPVYYFGKVPVIKTGNPVMFVRHASFEPQSIKKLESSSEVAVYLLPPGKEGTLNVRAIPNKTGVRGSKTPLSTAVRDFL